jgi:hypothetical protein
VISKLVTLPALDCTHLERKVPLLTVDVSSIERLSPHSSPTPQRGRRRSDQRGPGRTPSLDTVTNTYRASDPLSDRPYSHKPGSEAGGHISWATQRGPLTRIRSFASGSLDIRAATGYSERIRSHRRFCSGRRACERGTSSTKPRSEKSILMASLENRDSTTSRSQRPLTTPVGT